ncbi:hypothetical protein RHGRI_000972 [Rhododendron griersonianum]|uniref:Uncharacterized protein n=1 Tax=Rhododendron griersonianum TaxID=479676 RepID=A0AAV6LKR5_9ERIC|nr:hypothetical protein RHGRI_000972 [Rhododendron griersonianum]
MAGYASMKMKRKDLEEVNDDFSDFSLSSPARKIRRLDADLPPIMEEEEPEVPFGFNPRPMGDEHIPSYMEQTGGLGSCPIIGESSTVPGNEERALVLFRPMSTPLLLSPSNFSVSVNSDIISGIKNQIVWSVQSNGVKSKEDEAERQGFNTTRANESLAIVPWVPSQVPSPQGIEVPEAELMESDDAGAATMDIEETNVAAEPGKEWQLSGMTNGFSNQWQQQHCMVPQLPQNTSTPIVWYR